MVSAGQALTSLSTRCMITYTPTGPPNRTPTSEATSPPNRQGGYPYTQTRRRNRARAQASTH
eukprot:4300373-Alexandrium_andersonii.AAC.1